MTKELQPQHGQIVNIKDVPVTFMDPQNAIEVNSVESALHPAEIKLIALIRSIEFGEIENLKIQNGLPVTYKMAWKTGKFV